MSTPHLFDAEALMQQFQNATQRQGDQLKAAVAQATMSALQGRELTMRNIKSSLKAVSDAAAKGVAQNPLASGRAEELLDRAVAGMDEALLKAVEANRAALANLAKQGADLRDGPLKKALSELDRMEDSLLDAVRKAAAGDHPMAQAWGQVLGKWQGSGTQVGAQAAQATAQLLQAAEQWQAQVRHGRAAAMKGAQSLADSYTALVSGVLLGMGDMLAGQAPAARDKAKK